MSSRDHSIITIFLSLYSTLTFRFIPRLSRHALFAFHLLIRPAPSTACHSQFRSRMVSRWFEDRVHVRSRRRRHRDLRDECRWLAPKTPHQRSWPRRASIVVARRQQNLFPISTRRRPATGLRH